MFHSYVGLPEGTWRMIGLVVLSFKMLTTQGFNQPNMGNAWAHNLPK